MNMFTAICILGLVTSLWLSLRQRLSRVRRVAGAILQTLIWLTVWSLFQPPSLLPLERSATLEISSLSDLKEVVSPQKIVAAEALRISGDGMPRDALRDLPPVRLLPGEFTDASGWQLDWPRTATLGEPLQFRITLQQKHQYPVKFTLQDPFGSDADSVTVDPDHTQVTLRAWPKIEGNWLYQVRVEVPLEMAPPELVPPESETTAKGGTIVRSEALPVVVRESQSPRVLLWLARPGFESAALARWLRQSATPTQVVTQLAPEVQRRETFNGQALQKRNLLADGSPFDLFILDSRLWPQLSAEQQQQLVTIAQSKSLLWLVDDNSPQGFLDYIHTQGLPLDSAVAATATFPRDVIEGPSSEEAPELHFAGFQPATMHETDTQIAAGKHALYWARVESQHSLGLVFFRNSYRWQTSGHAREFALLWKHLFDRQLAFRGNLNPVQVNTEFPRAEQRLTLCSTAFGDTPAQLISHSTNDTTTSHSGVAGVSGEQGRCYSYWPQREGWHQLDNSDYWLYIFAHDAWPEWQTALNRQETAQLASARLGPETILSPTRQPIPRSWLVLALLVFMSLTWWLERPSLR